MTTLFISLYTNGEKNICAPKMRKNMMLSNISFFKYCDINIRLFYIAPCKVIALNLLCFFFMVLVLCVFISLLSLKLSLFRYFVTLGYHL